MPLPYLVAVKCKLAPAMFSSERVFAITLADGKEYRGTAPRDFCWNKDGRLVGEKEPSEEADGWVAAKVIEEQDDGQVIVEVPDGAVLAVPRSPVHPRPTPIRPPRAPEPKSDVPA
jgi:hypothetical protein